MGLIPSQALKHFDIYKSNSVLLKNWTEYVTSVLPSVLCCTALILIVCQYVTAVKVEVLTFMSSFVAVMTGLRSLTLGS